MAERVGFEPTCPVKDNPISSRARYGQLRYLSAAIGEELLVAEVEEFGKNSALSLNLCLRMIAVKSPQGSVFP